MKFRKQRYIESLAKAPMLRTIRTAYSVRYHVFNPKINEQLCSISRQGNFNLITVNYGRLKHWLKKGLSFHPSNLLETDQILWHKGLTSLSKKIYEHMVPQIVSLPSDKGKKSKCISKPHLRHSHHNKLAQKLFCLKLKNKK